MSEEEKQETEELAPEEEEKLPFPTAAVVRLMRANLDKEKIIKKDVKIAMNKWLGKLCESVTKEMNKANYVTMSRYDFERAIEIYEKVAKFNEEKQRILAHMEAIKRDIERLEKDLGKKEEI
jgi:histone H3/H4